METQTKQCAWQDMDFDLSNFNVLKERDQLKHGDANEKVRLAKYGL
jgi:hypothetical protein